MDFESVSIERPLQIVQTKSTSTVGDVVTTDVRTSKKLSLCDLTKQCHSFWSENISVFFYPVTFQISM